MEKPRIVIADTDEGYISTLVNKFVKELFDKVNIEVITDKDYFDEFFSKGQRIDVLIVSENLYNNSLRMHEIGNTFVMTEQLDEGGTEDLSVLRLFKYTNAKEIFNEITGNSNLSFMEKTDSETQIIAVTSAFGGAGKTTLSFGICASLAKNHRKVLYINASGMQSFQCRFSDIMPIQSSALYSKLMSPGSDIYSALREEIKEDGFYYLPAFKASLMSLGLSFGVFEQIIMQVKSKGDFDYIVVDVNGTIDTDRARLMDIANHVVIITGQTRESVFATKLFVSNLSMKNIDKFLFVCNRFEKDRYNALLTADVNVNFTVSEYIKKFDDVTSEHIMDLASKADIRRMTFLVM